MNTIIIPLLPMLQNLYAYALLEGGSQGSESEGEGKVTQGSRESTCEMMPFWLATVQEKTWPFGRPGASSSTGHMLPPSPSLAHFGGKTKTKCIHRLTPFQRLSLNDPIFPHDSIIPVGLQVELLTTLMQLLQELDLMTHSVVFIWDWQWRDKPRSPILEG